MSIESTPPSLPSLTGVTIYRAEGPRGILKIAAHTDASMLAERLYQLWLHDGLPELARALAAEREHYPTAGKTRCHEVAFEFAYGSFVNVGDPEHPALRDWKWCVGATVGRDTHSWIENLGEAFDSAMVLADGKPEQVLWVRQGTGAPVNGSGQFLDTYFSDVDLGCEAVADQWYRHSKVGASVIHEQRWRWDTTGVWRQ